MGEYPRKKEKERTHFTRKFKTKRDQWNWMKKHMPEACDLVILVKEKFGDLQSVTVQSPIRRGSNPL
jgi:RNase P protein component